jgi:HEAT repeat protein
MQRRTLFIIVIIVIVAFGIWFITYIERMQKIPVLMGEMGDSDFDIAGDAMDALTKYGPKVVPALAEVVRAPAEDAIKRARAAQVLGLIGSRHAAKPLVDAMEERPPATDEDALKQWTDHDELRWNAAIALGKIDAHEAIPVLERHMMDEDETLIVRISCVRGLALMGSTGSVTKMTAILDDRPPFPEKTPKETKAAVKETTAATEEKKEAQAAATEAVQVTTAEKAAEKKGEAAVGEAEEATAAVKEAKEVTAAEKQAKATAATETKGVEAEAAEEEKPEGAPADLRIAVCQALSLLGTKGGPEVQSLIAAATREGLPVKPAIEPDLGVAQWACYALGDIADPTAEPILVANLTDVFVDVNEDEIDDDTDGDVRIAAAYALGRIGSKEAIPALQTSLEDKSYWVRDAAYKSLRELGQRLPKGKYAAPLP